MTETRHFLVSGTVQGVGFRASTQHEAERLSLAGWVANRADGDVAVMARGPAADLDTLAKWLGHGPASATVNEVAETAREDTPDLPRPFEIR